MIQDAHRLRQGIYRLLSAGFGPVSTDFLAAADGSIDVLDGLGIFDYAYAPDVVTALGRFAEPDADELRIAYVELFEIGVDGVPCQLRESAHLGDSRTGEVALIQSELRHCYERYGVSFDADQPDQVDHVSTELGAMASLCAMTVDRVAGHGGDSTLGHQSDLLTEHVLCWVPQLTREMLAVECHPAYSALARATLGFLEHERQHLPILAAQDAAPAQ